MSDQEASLKEIAENHEITAEITRRSVMAESDAAESKTLREVAEEYIDSLVFTETKANTISVYLKCIQLATDYFGPQRTINSIALLHVGKFFNSPAILKLPNGKPRADLTIKQIKRVFRQCMEFALEKGYILNSPIPKSEMEHARTKTIPTKSPELTEEEILKN